MTKTILLTGATDGIGFETAKILAAQKCTLLLHGRSAKKLAHIKAQLMEEFREIKIETYQADLSDLTQVKDFADSVKAQHTRLDVLINNAGVFVVPNTQTIGGYDVRFIVNMVSPYLLTQALLPLMDKLSRVINLSSAAQAPVDLSALKGQQRLSDNAAYAQSKLGITMWTFELAEQLKETGPSLIAVNPASFLGSKMVKDAYGTAGKDLTIGANILVRAALSEEFAGKTAQYFDNDIGTWARPHPDALSREKNQALIAALESILERTNITIN